MIKKISLLLCLILIFSVGCAAKNTASNEDNYQLNAPGKKDTIAIMKTNMGDIKIRFFPEAAPKAVENFITHAKDGYYNGLTFHRVIDNFMIQGGDPSGTGTGGESIWGKPFEDEFSDKLHNFRGALSMANSGENTNGSQFFIVQKKTVEPELEKWMQDMAFDEKVIEKYKEVGGTPWLDNHHTVFGQVFEGIEVVDKIAAVETGANNLPVEPITIESIEIQN